MLDTKAITKVQLNSKKVRVPMSMHMVYYCFLGKVLIDKTTSIKGFDNKNWKVGVDICLTKNTHPCPTRS